VNGSHLRKTVSAHCLFATILAGLLVCLPIRAYADATYDGSTSEFERALDLIDQTQLELFVHSTPTSPSEVLLELNRRLNSPDHPKQSQSGHKRKVRIMRGLLAETIDQYEDQYANYISPKNLIAYSERRAGTYVGVGLKYRSVTGDYPLVIGALLGGPLEHHDIKPGDRLIAVDDIDLKGSSSTAIKQRLKGAPDTTFRISVSRAGKKHTVTSKRRKVDLHYARAEVLADNIGYIRDIFGRKLKDFNSPENGIVIGKSVSPVNQSGGRILHLGIVR